MNRKADVAIPVTILVFLTVALIVFTLFTFVSNKEKLRSEISARILENIYAKEEIMEFYFQKAVDATYSASEFGPAFIAELGKYDKFKDWIDKYNKAAVKTDLLDFETIAGKLNVNLKEVIISDIVTKDGIEKYHVIYKTGFSYERNI